MARLFISQSDRQHRFCASNLSAYSDDALSVRDKLQVERHLAECVLCQQDLATLRQTRALLRRTPMRPVPRSFTLPAVAQPEQARYRRWTATQSFLRVATAAITLMLVLLISGDVLFSMGVLPVPDRPRPVREVSAVPAYAGTVPAVGVEPTRAAGQEESLAQLEATAPEEDDGGPLAYGQAAAAETTPLSEGQSLAEEQPAKPELAAKGEASSQVLAAPQATDPESLGALQGGAAAGAEDMATAAPAVAAMAPRRAAASPAQPSLEHGVPSEAASGMGAGPAAVEPVQAPAATAPKPLPTMAPTTAPLSTEAPLVMAVTPTAATPTSGPLAMGSDSSSTTREAPAAAEPAPERLSPVWALWRNLRLLWMGLLGLFFVLLAALLWTGAKTRT